MSGGHTRVSRNDRRLRIAGATKVNVVDGQRAMTNGTSSHDHWFLSGRQNDGIADVITARVQKIEVNTEAVSDKEILVTCFAAASVTDDVGSKNSTEFKVPHFIRIMARWILPSQPVDFIRQPWRLVVFGR